MRRALARSVGVVAVAAAGAIGPLAGCGDDEAGPTTAEPTSAEPTSIESEEDTTVPSSDAPTVAGVTLTAAVRLDRRQVVFDYTLANTGDDAVAVVDTATVIDTLEPVGDAAYRASFLRTEGDAAGGAPLPPLRGVVVAAGGELTATAAVTGQFERLPDAVQLCIEVVPPRWTDAGGGVAEFPYRSPGTEPALACTEQIPVPAAG
jgi:hypothetical protein